MRRVALLLTLLLAGCGSDAEQHAATQTAPAAATTGDSTVFTVPDELPPRARPTHTPDRAGARHEPVADAPAEGAPTDAEVQRELAAALGLEPGADVVDQAGLTEDGLATIPPSAPPEVAAIINAGNKVARAPYRYGGGHGGIGDEGIWVDSAYDCSGSVSFALASAGLLDSPLDSTSFMRWGKPGPGKWVTIFANHGHAFMVVAGLRFDTVERARTGTRWGRADVGAAGFALRHPAGL